MISWLLALLFYICLFLWTLVLSPSLLFLWMPRSLLFKVSKTYAKGILLLCKVLLRLDYKIVGVENLPKNGSYIIASKHQSAFETFFFHAFLPQSVFFLKKSLFYIPIVGFYFQRLGMIPVYRFQKKNLLSVKEQRQKKIRKALDSASSIVIFPEGTRTMFGEKGTYQAGVYHMSKDFGQSVVPVALNAGFYWPRRSFLKKKGVITISFLPKMMPGNQNAIDFMSALETAIEKEMQTISSACIDQK